MAYPVSYKSHYSYQQLPQESDTDELFDRIQHSVDMSEAISHFNTHFQPKVQKPMADRPKLSEWQIIWPAISEALILEMPEGDFPDPDASFDEIKAFLMSNKSLPFLERITKLDFSGLDLSSVSSVLMRCPNLEELDLSNNPRLEVLPEWMASLKNLKILEIQDTRIAYVPLMRVFVISNENRGVLGETQSLDLSGLNLKSVPSILKRCPNLEELDLSNNPRLQVLPDWMADLITLETIKIQDTGIVHFPPKLALLPNLQTLWVSEFLKTRMFELPETVRVMGFYPSDHDTPLQNHEERERGISGWQLAMRKTADPALLMRLGLTPLPR